MSLSQLIELRTVEGAVNFILEKEIEGVLRKSHVEQFAWMEVRFDIKLRSNLERWPVFVELTQRRNLFAHADGVVSSQYLEVCKAQAVIWEQVPAVGDELDVGPEYFKQSYECVVEIAIKLAHVLWRKLQPSQIEEADTSLISTIFELLLEENYELAVRLGEFACETLRKHSEIDRRIFVINLAQAYRWLGRTEECDRVLDNEDWSAAADKFQLGVAS